MIKMMLGVSLKIDVTKIDKARLYKGAKGTYLDATVFIDVDNPDQYGNNGMITQSVSKEERDAGAKGAILGNSKVFLKKGGNQAPNAAPQQEAPASPTENEDDIPF
tara:strand:+ start:1921 stop:2238 length:318 start_codon:yes stop_codon:yes gene_type:complete